ncbi:MAG: GTPase [Thermodesulfobacteriota bacterium]|nr:GTPase [Thermodesulfobacteriota bacterium]
MPANLPPQYFEVEKEYRLAKTNKEKIKALEAMLTIVPKHKGTDKLRGQLRKKISRLKDESQKKHATSKRGYFFNIEKEGAAQVVLTGPPNVGKSEILSRVTKALSEIADYPFTTRKPIAGMMRFENIQIQLVDTPPLAKEYTEQWIFNIIRNADALLMVADLGTDPLEQLETTLEELKRHKVKPIGKGLMEKADEGFVNKSTLIVCNKNDLDGAPESFEALQDLYGEEFSLISISATEGVNLEQMKRSTFEILNIIRVYTKAPGKAEDRNAPFILKRGRTVQDLAERVHKDFAKKLKYARIWGSEKYSGQMVQKDHVLRDGDIIELHI